MRRSKQSKLWRFPLVLNFSERWTQGIMISSVFAVAACSIEESEAPSFSQFRGGPNESESSIASETDFSDSTNESETSEDLGDRGDSNESSESSEEGKDVSTSQTEGGESTGVEDSEITDEGNLGDAVEDVTSGGEVSTSSEGGVGVTGEDFGEEDIGSEDFGEEGAESEEFGEEDTGADDGDDDDDDNEGAVLGEWNFNDCSRQNQILLDSSPNGLHAVRSSGLRCRQGPDGLAARFKRTDDVITIGNGPLLKFKTDLAFSVWIRPNNIRREQIVLERGNGTRETFSLRVVDRNVEFRVENRRGVVSSSAAPIKRKEWTHVAGIYDGSFIFLFVNGEQVGQVSARGKLRNPRQALRIGQGAEGKPFKGKIDELWLSNEPVQPFQLTERSCISRPFDISIDPDETVPVSPEQSVSFEVTVTNRNFGASCRESDYFFDEFFFDPDIESSFSPRFVSGVGLEESAMTSLTLSPTAEAGPGIKEVPFGIFEESSQSFQEQEAAVLIDVQPFTGCTVRTNRELMITDLSVVEDPIRSQPGDPNDPVGGTWHFKRLMENMAPIPEDAPRMVEALFSTWLTTQTVNSFDVPARVSMRDIVLDEWPRTENGQLDLAEAPIRLLAIVNRFDLRDLDEQQAGEGRFVFGITQNGFPLQFTLILEYALPAQTEAEVQDWANAWHALGELPMPSEEYNAALQAITDRFTGRNVSPLRVNGSAINQIRSNEIDLADPWELREFNLDADSGFLKPVTVKLTPDIDFNSSELLGTYINENEADILLEQHRVPEQFNGVSFLAGAITNNIDAWFAPDVQNNEARHKFSLNTCNGCHGQETETEFLHVFPRFEGEPAGLSRFLRGGVVFDPATGEQRVLDDLQRRKDDMMPVVCTESIGARSREQAPNLRKGISRVH